MKTPEEIKKGLEHCAGLINDGKYCAGCPYLFEDCDDLARDALAYIQQLEAQAPKWISVEERLPEMGDIVLVIANGKPREHITLIDAILIASCWGEEGWIADGFDGWDKLEVTHWMPLPEGPKEG